MSDKAKGKKEASDKPKNAGEVAAKDAAQGNKGGKDDKDKSTSLVRYRERATQEKMIDIPLIHPQ